SRLFGLALGEKLGAEFPLGIGATAPGAGSGAGRVDDDAVKLADEIIKGAGIGRADLNIAKPIALEAIIDRRETRAVAVIGEDLALVTHCGRESEGLTTCAGAEIEHLIAGLGTAEGGDDLAALILHLEPALEIGFIGGDIGRARIAGAGRKRQTKGGERRLLGRETGQRLVY